MSVVVPDRPLPSYVMGWKISPSHYLNQDLANLAGQIKKPEEKP